jgi:hypothetical protein
VNRPKQRRQPLKPQKPNLRKAVHQTVVAARTIATVAHRDQTTVAKTVKTAILKPKTPNRMLKRLRKPATINKQMQPPLSHVVHAVVGVAASKAPAKQWQRPSSTKCKPSKQSKALNQRVKCKKPMRTSPWLNKPVQPRPMNKLVLTSHVAAVAVAVAVSDQPTQVQRQAVRSCKTQRLMASQVKPQKLLKPLHTHRLLKHLTPHLQQRQSQPPNLCRQPSHSSQAQRH